MARLDQRVLYARTNLASDSGTWTFRLPRALQINNLRVMVDWTNGGTNNQDQSVYDAIDRVELKANGNRVLFSLTGQQCRVWGHFFNKARLPFVRSEVPDVVQTAILTIPFGMSMFDTSHYLDTSRWNDVTLEITYSPDIGATDFLTSTGYITVYADVWVPNPPEAYAGMLRLTEQYYFTTAASGDQSIELPLLNPHLAIGVYCYESGVSPGSNITNIELEINDREFIPVSGSWNYLNSKYAQMLGIHNEEYGVIHKQDDDTWDTKVGDVDVLVLTGEQDPTIATTDIGEYKIESIAGGLATLLAWYKDAAAGGADAAYATDGVVKWIAKGKYGIGHFTPLVFGYPDMPSLALPSNNFHRELLKLTQGNAGAECRVSLLELVQG